MRLQAQDIPQVLALEKLCFSMPWGEAQFQAAFHQRHFAAFGLRAANQDVLAYISFYHALDELEILNIAVTPALRRRGLGGHLLKLTLQIAKKMAIVRAVLEVRVHNVPALKLYEGLGFVCAGRRPKYYTDTGEDALIYALSLID